MGLQILKTIGGPGSLGFLVVGAAVGSLLLYWKRTRRLGRALLLMLAGIYLILSLPVVAQLLAGPGTERAAPLSSYGKLGEIFVIDGDNYRSRAVTTAELAAVAKPDVVWFLGGVDLGYELLANGLPPKLWRRTGSAARTTRDQILWIKGSIDRTRAEPAAVVASRLQAPRVLALARHEQLNVLVIPAPLDDEPPASGFRFWLPSLSGLANSREALYERLAVLYYRRNGWIQ
jgi:uncharacterized SAM-binding protein YcdF (DUF218 family)